MDLGQSAGLVEARQAFLVLHDLAVAEAGAVQRGGHVFGQRCGEAQQRRLHTRVAGTSLAVEGAAAEGGPLLELGLVVGAVA